MCAPCRAADFYSHAPCGARRYPVLVSCDHGKISTHTPHAGRDQRDDEGNESDQKFLLTRPMRGATGNLSSALAINPISTHTPHAGRDGSIKKLRNETKISTHTPHAGRDGAEIHQPWRDKKFLLTRPMRGATKGDTIMGMELTRPMRGATCTLASAACPPGFLLTRLLRGATSAERYTLSLDTISTHTPLARRDK